MQTWSLTPHPSSPVPRSLYPSPRVLPAPGLPPRTAVRAASRAHTAADVIVQAMPGSGLNPRCSPARSDKSPHCSPSYRELCAGFPPFPPLPFSDEAAPHRHWTLLFPCLTLLFTPMPGSPPESFPATQSLPALLLGVILYTWLHFLGRSVLCL